MLKKFCAWIVSRVDNRKIVHAFEILRKIQHLSKRKIHKLIDSNAETNLSAWQNHDPNGNEKPTGTYIENQRDFSDMRFGKTTVKYAGCEILAVFNLFRSLQNRSASGDEDCQDNAENRDTVFNAFLSLPKLISEFEADGMMLAGRAGTAPKAIRDFLVKQGFRTSMVTDSSAFDKLGEEADSLILTMFNNGLNVFEQVHTINISKEGAGFVAHNVYGDGRTVGPFASVSEVIAHINEGRARGISLIGVKTKNKSGRSENQ